LEVRLPESPGFENGSILKSGAACTAIVQEETMTLKTKGWFQEVKEGEGEKPRERE